jgi:hypothetical protein
MKILATTGSKLLIEADKEEVANILGYKTYYVKEDLHGFLKKSDLKDWIGKEFDIYPFYEEMVNLKSFTDNIIALDNANQAVQKKIELLQKLAIRLSENNNT